MEQNMNRKLWSERSFCKESPPQYPCPKCSTGILNIINGQSQITPNGEELENLQYPYGIEHMFAGILQCSNLSCKKVISFCGIKEADIEICKETPNGEKYPYYFSRYTPKFLNPNLRLFKLPNSIPRNIINQIDLSFAHYFNDLASCVNRLRSSIELILDDIKAPKRKKKNNGTFFKLRTLHSRIEHFAKKQKKIAELMLAIKFIGNEGSHVGEIHINDVLDAYEILYELIDIIYIKSQEKTLNLAKEINKNRKPRSHKN